MAAAESPARKRKKSHTKPIGMPMKPLVQLGKGPNECWSWLAGSTNDGYPVKRSGCGDTTAQRWLWRVLFGPLPDDIKITTSCGNRGCMNPHHFHAETQAGVTQGGIKAILTPAEVVSIRAQREGATTHTKVALAARHDVSVETIENIWGGRTWRHAAKAKAAARDFTKVPRGGLAAARRARKSADALIARA